MGLDLREEYSTYDTAKLQTIATSGDYTEVARGVARELLLQRGEVVVEAPPVPPRPTARSPNRLGGVALLAALLVVSAGLQLYRQHTVLHESPPPMPPLPVWEDSSPTGPTALVAAARACEGRVVSAQLATDIDPNAPGEGTFPETAMHAAAASGCVEVIRLLAAKGAHLNVGKWYRAGDGTLQEMSSPLTSAIHSGRAKVAGLLVELGADVNRKFDDEYPLQVAIETFPRVSNFDPQADPPLADESVQLIELLLEKGARTDIRSRSGETLEQLVERKFALGGEEAPMQALGNPSATVRVQEVGGGSRQEGEAVELVLARGDPVAGAAFYKKTRVRVLELLRRSSTRRASP